jgi:Mrp family chromosome partitioning ATPase
MAKSENASAVTAIHGSDFESFAASTLFSQGWSVLYRALDWSSLHEFLQGLTAPPDVLLISTDLEGIDPQSLHKLATSGMRIFIFRKSDEDLRKFPDSFAQPTVALELIAMIRGSMRRPMLRVSEPTIEAMRAHVLAIAGAHAGAGCTSLSINIATELSLLAKKVLIIDGNAIAPAIAILLGQQGLNSAKSFQKIANNLWALEVTQENIAESVALLDAAKMEFDYIVIDTGVITELAQVLRGQRWTGEILVWASSHADELWIISKSNRVGVERVRRISQALSQNSIKPAISFVQAMSAQGKKGAIHDEAFLAAVRTIGPKNILAYLADPRSIAIAENEQTSLYESNERSLLRKSIATLAGEVGG